MDRALRVTLVANAGLLLEFDGVRILMDAIYGRKGHPFSNLRPEMWEELLAGEPPFDHIDYLFFTHRHPDHFTPRMVLEYLKVRHVRGVFMPQCEEAERCGLTGFLKEHHIPCVELSPLTNRASFRIEPRIVVRPIQTWHLDEQFRGVPHFCFLINFGGRQVLFTADADYVHERFEQLSGTFLSAVFINPLFFNAIRSGHFFRGQFNTARYCIYHIPFSGEDSLKMRDSLARDVLRWPLDGPEVDILCDPLQHIEL